MRIFIVIATKGRPKEMSFLLDNLQSQTLQSTFVIVVGTEESDLAHIRDHPFLGPERGEAFISPRIGTTAQRNFGLEMLKQRGFFDVSQDRFFCVFLDDDFRLAPDWLERAHASFIKYDIAGLTGRLLADGVKSGGLTENEAADLIMKDSASRSSGEAIAQAVPNLYGCNMAYSDTVIRHVRFDEALPLYGWMEDRDYSVQASRLGRLVYSPDCVGVHLGISGGRTSGVRFGYSQIANPFYLKKKGTVGYVWIIFIFRALTSNIFHSLMPNTRVDYRGRLRGNIRALFDMILLRSEPRAILKL